MIAIDEPTKTIVLAAGRTKTYESCETEWFEAERVSIPIPADAGTFDKKPVTKTCAWQAAASTRPTLEINVKNRVISLVSKNK